MSTDQPEPVEYLNCPFCLRKVEVSEFDPAASFTETLDHIGLQHPRADMSPSKLWPRIKVTNG